MFALSPFAFDPTEPLLMHMVRFVQRTSGFENTHFMTIPSVHCSLATLMQHADDVC